MSVISSRINKKIVKPTPFGSVCIIWSVSKKFPGLRRFAFKTRMVSRRTVAAFFP